MPFAAAWLPSKSTKDDLVLPMVCQRLQVSGCPNPFPDAGSALFSPFFAHYVVETIPDGACVFGPNIGGARLRTRPKAGYRLDRPRSPIPSQVVVTIPLQLSPTIVPNETSPSLPEAVLDAGPPDGGGDSTLDPRSSQIGHPASGLVTEVAIDSLAPAQIDIKGAPQPSATAGSADGSLQSHALVLTDPVTDSKAPEYIAVQSAHLVPALFDETTLFLAVLGVVGCATVIVVAMRGGAYLAWRYLPIVKSDLLPGQQPLAARAMPRLGRPRLHPVPVRARSSQLTRQTAPHAPGPSAKTQHGSPSSEP